MTKKKYKGKDEYAEDGMSIEIWFEGNLHCMIDTDKMESPSISIKDFYYNLVNRMEIISKDGYNQILAGTECRCTNKKDKTGQTIYEGDIVIKNDKFYTIIAPDHIGNILSERKSNEDFYLIDTLHGASKEKILLSDNYDLIVIGNTFDNMALAEELGIIE